MKQCGLQLFLAFLVGIGAFIGCDKSAKDADDSTKASATGAKETNSDDLGTEITAASIELIESLAKIYEDVESVDDAEAARPRIAEALETIVPLLNKRVALVSSMTDTEKASLMAEMEKQQTEMMNDPSYQLLTARSNKTRTDLMEKNPEAGATLEKIMNEEMAEMMEAMASILKSLLSSSTDAQYAPADTTE